jgi:hypothetical protein
MAAKKHAIFVSLHGNPQQQLAVNVSYTTTDSKCCGLLEGEVT